MSEDIRRTGTDAPVDEQRAYEGDAERRDLRDDDPARRDETITSDPARHDDRSTAHDGMLAGEQRRDPVVDSDRRDGTTDARRAEGTATDAGYAGGTDAGYAGGAATNTRDVGRDPSSERRGPTAGPGTDTEWSDGLLSSDDRTGYQKRWDDIQVRFIDEPRESVRQADDLVSEVTSRIADRFSSARRDMEQRWEGGDEPTTEELRRAVQRYRDFFQRLVAQ